MLLRLLLCFCLLGCVSEKLARTKHVVSDAIALSREAAPRIDGECIAAIAQTGADSDAVIDFCDPIVSEYNALREKHKTLREAVEQLEGTAGADQARVFGQLEIETMTEDLARATKRFRATLADWPKLKAPKPAPPKENAP